MKMNNISILISVFYYCLSQSEVSSQLVTLKAEPEVVVVGGTYKLTCSSTRKTGMFKIVQPGATSLNIMITLLNGDNKVQTAWTSKFPQNLVSPAHLDRATTTPSVSITSVATTAKENIDYQCGGSDETGGDYQPSSVVKVRVGLAPTDIVITGDAATRKKYDVVKINCSSNADADSNPVFKIDDVVVTPSASGTNTLTAEKDITITDPETQNGMTVKCDVSNYFGSKTKTSQPLYIEYPPTFLVNGFPTITQTFIPGDILTCTTNKGNPASTAVKWTGTPTNLDIQTDAHQMMVKDNLKEKVTEEVACQATQGAQTVSKTFEITLDKILPTTTTPEPTTQTATTTETTTVSDTSTHSTVLIVTIICLSVCLVVAVCLAVLGGIFIGKRIYGKQENENPRNENNRAGEDPYAYASNGPDEPYLEMANPRISYANNGEMDRYYENPRV